MRRERLLHLMVLQDEPIGSYGFEGAGASEGPPAEPLRLRITHNGWKSPAA